MEAMISTVVIVMKRPTLNSSFCVIRDPVTFLIPTIVEYMGFCNQIIHLPQGVRQETPVPVVVSGYRRACPGRRSHPEPSRPAGASRRNAPPSSGWDFSAPQSAPWQTAAGGFRSALWLLARAYSGGIAGSGQYYSIPKDSRSGGHPGRRAPPAACEPR